jgi:hypothetical protein
MAINLMESKIKALPVEKNQKYFDKQYDLTVDPEKIKRLKETANIDERQEILNSIFTKKRQEKMVADASLDIKGRKVRYYRYMPFEDFLRLLENKKIRPTGRSGMEQVPQTKFNEFLSRYLEDQMWSAETDYEKKRDFLEKAQTLSTPELLRLVFPRVSQKAAETLLADLTYQNVRKFFDDKIDLKNKLHYHIGSYWMKFFSYLSASVGGIIRKHLRPNEVYAEMIIPDDAVIVGERHFEGEKEALFKEMNLSNISRVYAGYDQLHEEIVDNPQTAIGQIKESRSSLSKIETWRWKEPTIEYLPVSVYKKIKKKK